VRFNDDSDSIVEISLGCDLEPGETLLLTYNIKKMLRNFDEYPNDVARGFNLPHMPIRFKAG